MDLISVPQYISLRDAQSQATFVSGRQMSAATSFTAVLNMDRASSKSRIQIYDHYIKSVAPVRNFQLM
jgi:hypothetical protein